MSELESPTIAAVDLFCGAGGLTYGLARGGVTVRAGIDLDPACKYPYEENNEAVFVERDVNSLTAEDVRTHFRKNDVSLLAGCAPCQPFSTYSRSGRSKKRAMDWQLVSTFGRLVADIQPDLVTMENVAQLADHPVFEGFLGFLEGYRVNWSIIECARIGVPQTRRRLVLLASRLGKERLDIAEDDSKRAKTVRETIRGLPRISAGEQHTGDPLHISSRLSPMNMRRIIASKPGGTWRDWEPELRAACHHKTTGSTYPSVYGRMTWDDPAPTITTQCFGYGNGRFGHPEQNRAISLREAAMLQTFPRDYRFVRPGEPVRFSVLGRLIGNAVPVRLGEVIGMVLNAHVNQVFASGGDSK